jgi:predicted secreted protein
LSKPEDKMLTTFVKSLSASLWSTLAVILLVSAVAVALVVLFFGLRVSGGIALYFVIWWILLFAILPIGVQSQSESGHVVSGTEPGAPSAPGLPEKAIWTTLVSAVVLLIAAAVFPLAGL